MHDMNWPPELGDLTWTEARDLLLLRPVALLPIGAVEAHGPHLPLTTDVIIARGMARYAGAFLHRSGLPAVVLPPIAYSVSLAGACFPGTMPVDQGELQSYLTRILISAASHGFRAICVCNAHLEPAHVETVTRSVAAALESSTVPVLFPDKRDPTWSLHLGDEFQGGSRHAGCYETSIVMAEAPELVRRTHMEELEPVWIDLPAALRAGARDFVEAGADMGYFGDPRSASEEQGIELLTTLGTLIRDGILEALANQPPSEGSS
jgi:creatinine amidohydrolase